jgi:hypothetical protein
MIARTAPPAMTPAPGAAGFISADDFVGDRSPSHRDRDHVAARSVDSLADGLRHFVRLAGRKTNSALTISDCDERVE